jgi:hypothetical protein
LVELGELRVELSDSREIRAAPATVWAALFDPEVLRRCIPGCTEMTGERATGYTALIRQKIGPVSVNVRVRLTLTDIVEGRAVTITGAAKGGNKGQATGTARVSLAPSDTGTTLSYTVGATITGKVLNYGAPLIDRVLRRLSDQFFASLQDAVEPATAGEMAAAGPDAPPARGWFRRMLGG